MVSDFCYQFSFVYVLYQVLGSHYYFQLLLRNYLAYNYIEPKKKKREGFKN